MMSKKKPSSKSYDVGYARPPKKFRFKRGQSGNPSGTKRTPPSATADLRASLERALNEKVTFRQGEKDRTLSRGAAGIEQLVDQFAAGDRNARRDLMVLAEKLGIDLTAGHSRAIESALEQNLAAEDEALLADFVKRHGGQYPLRADTVPSLPAKDANLLSPPSQNAKLLSAPPEDSTDSQIVQPRST
jgi:hypothetical protein